MLWATAPSLLQCCKRQRCNCCDLGSFDVRPTFIGLSSDDSFKPCRPVSYAMSSYVLFCHPAFSSNICLTSIQPSFDVHWTFVWPPCDLCVSRVIPNNALYSSNLLLALLEGVGWREVMFLHRCQPTRLRSDECRGTWKSKTKTGRFKPYIVLEFCNWGIILVQKFGAWDNTMSSDDESTTTHPELRYQLQSNTQPFEPISLSSWSSRQYHQTSTTPSSSSTTPIRNSGSGYTTSTVHQSPFGGVNQWGTLIAAPTFTPSSYTPLQVVTSTPIYTMEVNNSSGRIEKFSGRPGTISLREFKATFSTVVCELELKYGAN